MEFAELSLACLEVFHATHDFFALHLVTASHAARICAPLAGADFPGLYSTGIAAGYLAIGAPEFEMIPMPEDAVEVPLGLDPNSAQDEHDIKIAYVCVAQSKIRRDARYRWVAAQYLKDRQA